MNLPDKWNAAWGRSDVAIWLAPRLNLMPLPMARYDDPFLPFSQAIIEATSDLTCAYILDLASYLTTGAAGAVAFIPRSVVTILHGPFVTADYVLAASEVALAVDAVTLASAQPAVIQAYSQNPQTGAFLQAELGPTPPNSPANIGRYTAQEFSLGGQLARALGAEITYASRRADFETAARQSLQTVLNARPVL